MSFMYYINVAGHSHLAETFLPDGLAMSIKALSWKCNLTYAKIDIKIEIRHRTRKNCSYPRDESVFCVFFPA